MSNIVTYLHLKYSNYWNINTYSFHNTKYTLIISDLLNCYTFQFIRFENNK